MCSPRIRLQWFLVLFFLLLPAAAWANLSTAGLYPYPGGWFWLVALAVVAIEAPLLRWICRVNWPTALAAAVLANAVTTVVGVMFLGRVMLGMAFVLGGVNFLLEWPFVRPLVGAYWRPRAELAPRFRWPLATVVAVLLMNLVTAPLTPAVQHFLPPERMIPFLARSACQLRLEVIGGALQEYHREHGRLPADFTAEGLARALQPYADRELTLHCPGAPRGRFFPLPSGPQPYEFRAPEEGDWARPEVTPVIWDSTPRHRGRRLALYLDFRVRPLPRP